MQNDEEQVTVWCILQNQTIFSSCHVVWPNVIWHPTKYVPYTLQILMAVKRKEELLWASSCNWVHRNVLSP